LRVTRWGKIKKRSKEKKPGGELHFPKKLKK